MARVKCAWTGRIIAVKRDDRTGCYVGRCKCSRQHLAVVHPLTYAAAKLTVFAA